MPRIVVMIQVDDLATWERSFATHGDLYRRQTIKGEYDYTMIEDGNRVVLCADVDDLDAFFEVLSSPAADSAKDLDGVHRDSIEFFVLDKKLSF